MTVDWEELRREAEAAAGAAYCPYSRFPVGCAILAADGRIFSGCNVENVSYGLTICAERAAVCAMVRGGVREFAALALFAPTEAPITPCGACRQVLAELSPGAEVRCFCSGEQELVTNVAGLLPSGFDAAELRGGDQPR
jgi:cytidine deaminase